MSGMHLAEQTRLCHRIETIPANTMPLSGPSSYVPTLQEFLAHWALVNAELGAGNAMTLIIGPPANPETIDLADLTALRSDLEAAQNRVQSALNGVEFSGGVVKMGKQALLPLAQAYGRKVKGLFPPGSPALGMTPEMPEAGYGQEAFLRPLRDVADAWQKLEQSGSTFTLPPDGTTRAVFTGKVEDLASEWQSLNSAEVTYGHELDKRNALQERAAEMLGRYRPTVESLFIPENPLVRSIPRLRPLPGHTPAPVFLTAEWEPADNKARLSWTVSVDPELASYQIRMSPSATYQADAESIVATLPGGGVTEYFTEAGLPAPGATASYKIYVILATGNERGSDPAPVTRP